MNNQAIEMFQATVKFQEEYIWVKPICDFFEIDYEHTTKKIQQDQILTNEYVRKSSKKLFDDNYKRILLTKKGFIRWVQIINANTITNNLRERFIQFQALIFDFMFGSIEQNKKTRMLYQRLAKLESLRSKINKEIRSVKKQLNPLLDGRFLQTEFEFKQIEE